MTRAGGRRAGLDPCPRASLQSGREHTYITELYGKTFGLRANQLRRLRNLYKRRVPRHSLVPQDFARQLTELSYEIGRRVGALVSRAGRVEYVAIGDALAIELPDFRRVRGGAGRFRGLRFIHTSLSGKGLSRDDLTDLSLLRLDASVSLVVDDAGLPSSADYASLRPADESGELVERHEPRAPGRIDFDFLEWIEELERRFGEAQQGIEAGSGDRAILVGVSLGRDPDADERLEEMAELARTAGVAVLETVRQRRSRADPRYLIGKGKIQDLVIRAWQRGADLVIFDRDLTPTQLRQITDLVEERIVDRTQLILDIFAQHARTREGRLQVELAQLRYMLPRLVGRGESMSRLEGRIGGRGPGESKLEVDRRRARERIKALERSLATVARQRSTQSQRRKREGLPVLSIVGYTNAGKSTLLNRMTRSNVHTADQLFATVDPSSRRLRFPRERDVIVTDTVGFIRDLPPDLIAGFKATLEGIREADVLLHVVDATHASAEGQIDSVRGILRDLDLGDKPECLVLNKCDRLDAAEIADLADRFGGVPISAISGDGIDAMLGSLDALVFPREPDDLGVAAAGAD